MCRQVEKTITVLNSHPSCCPRPYPLGRSRNFVQILRVSSTVATMSDFSFNVVPLDIPAISDLMRLSAPQLEISNGWSSSPTFFLNNSFTNHLIANKPSYDELYLISPLQINILNTFPRTCGRFCHLENEEYLIHTGNISEMKLDIMAWLLSLS